MLYIDLVMQYCRREVVVDNHQFRLTYNSKLTIDLSIATSWVAESEVKFPTTTSIQKLKL